MRLIFSTTGGMRKCRIQHDDECDQDEVWAEFHTCTNWEYKGDVGAVLIHISFVVKLC